MQDYQFVIVGLLELNIKAKQLLDCKPFVDTYAIALDCMRHRLV